MNKDLTPKAIVAALDTHIIGQNAAKRAVAVALRNRWRRQQLPPALREEVLRKITAREFDVQIKEIQWSEDADDGGEFGSGMEGY